MSYVTAITDRTAADITNHTAKAFFNIADWVRIYGNASITNSLAEIMLSTPIVFNPVAAPVITDFASATNFNTLLANIERTRLAVVGESIPGTGTEIKDDYVAGASQPIFNYVDVNLWESTLNAIWGHFDGPDLEVCPTLTADLTILTGETVIYVDCLDAADFNIDIQGTGSLYII